MISMARTLGAPDRVPAGSVARNTSMGPFPGASAPRHLGGQVQDAGCSAPPPSSRPPPRAPKVTTRPVTLVAGQVHQHHVFGHLLRILDQLLLRGARPPGAAPRGREPAMGLDTTVPSRRRTMGSGDAPTTVTSGNRRK